MDIADCQRTVSALYANRQWAQAIRLARRAIRWHAQAQSPSERLPALFFRLVAAKAALDAPAQQMRRYLKPLLPPQASRRLKLGSAFAGQQAIQNAGGLLRWQMTGPDGVVQAAAYEKLFPVPDRLRGTTGRRADYRTLWLNEAYALAGLTVVDDSSTRCHLPRYLGLRRHAGAVGLLTEDLELTGWRPIDVEKAAQSAPIIAEALADFALRFRAHPPFRAPRWTVPHYRPFFTRLNEAKFDRMDRTLSDLHLDSRARIRLISALHRLNADWDAIVGIFPVSVPCHGDTYFRNILMKPDVPEAGIAMVDLENACLGPVGLDLGRFIGTTITRRIEAWALCVHQGGTVPPGADLWRNSNGLERFATQCETAYRRALARDGRVVSAADLRRISRAAALMGMIYGSSILLRAAGHAPDIVAPISGFIHSSLKAVFGNSQ